MTCCGADIGDLVSIEGRAIQRVHQGTGLGTLALHQLLDAHPDIAAAASVTRNPAIPRLMTRGFNVVSPDLGHENPLHHYKNNRLLRHLTEVYGAHVGADPATLPLVPNRYTGGLYGYADPGQHMGIPQLAESPEHGIIMIATERKR
jgi:hypothetical protein